MRAVVWSDDAVADFEQLVAYIAADNPAAADRAADRIEEAGAALGSLATGRRGRVTGTYEKVMVGLPYIIAYAIRAHGQSGEIDSVVILRIIHGARDWPAGAWPE
jgi:plasmid stabilization system protein ParE